MRIIANINQMVQYFTGDNMLQTTLNEINIIYYQVTWCLDDQISPQSEALTNN